jgi:hypothetical protein
VVDIDQPSSRELLFLQMISMFQVAAMQQLGKIVDPTTGEVTKALEQATVWIDILDVLKEKTKGNLSEVEGEFLDKVLFELHMNYVDELKMSDTSGSEREDSEGDVKGEGESAGASEDDAEQEKEEGKQDG